MAVCVAAPAQLVDTYRFVSTAHAIGSLVDLSLGSLSLDVRSVVLEPHSGNAGIARTLRGIAGILAAESEKTF